MLKKIASFTINHDTLTPGMYVSRIDGDCVTYDLRLKFPNQGDYVAQPALHTLEHLIATFVRSSTASEQVVYFGPMGCRTGFYFLTRSLSDGYSINLIKEAFQFIADYWGVIPGATMKECGNCTDHNLALAKEEAKAFLEIIKDWKKEDLKYPE